MWLYVTYFISFFFNHIVSNVGLSGTWDLQYLVPDRIILTSFSAKKSLSNQFMKCERYILIVKASELLLEVSMEREGRKWNFLRRIPPVARTPSGDYIIYRSYENGLTRSPPLFSNLVVALVRYLFFVYKNIES